jgi:hypothetical protein
MRIAYLEPFGRAWERMKLALFRPFDLHKWFVVGFNAFLAGLAESRNGSAGGRARGDMTFREFLDLPNRGWEWLTSHPGWFIAIGVLALVVIAVGIVLLWLSSRGKFMFLDNVVHNRAEIAKPWGRRLAVPLAASVRFSELRYIRGLYRLFLRRGTADL